MATLHLRHLSGKETLEKLTAAITEIYDGNVIRQITISTNLQDGHVRLENIAARVLTSQLPIKKLAEQLTERPFLYCRQIVVGFDHGEKVQYSTDEVLATIEIAGPSHMPPERFGDQLMKMIDVLGRYFTLTRKPEILNEHLTNEQREGMRYYERALSDLTAQAAQLGLMAATQGQENQKVLDQRLADLESRYEQREQALQADYTARSQILERREEELKEQAEQRAQVLEADYQARKQDVDRREQELEKQAGQRVQILEADYQARKQDVDRREQELEKRYEQRMQSLEADAQAKREDLGRREQDLKKQAEQQTQTLEASYQARNQDLERREQELKQRYEQQAQTLEKDYQARSRELERREQEQKQRQEQQAQLLEAEAQAKRQELERREQDLKQRHEQQAQALEADIQAKRQELERREQDLEKRYEQRVRLMEADAQARSEDWERRQQDLEKRYEQKGQTLAADYRGKSEELARREQEVQQQMEQMDMQARMVTRGELVKKMQELIEQQKEIRISPEMEQKRKTIHQVCIPALAGLGGLLAFVVIWMVSQTQATWYTLLPLGVVTAGFGWTLAFYLRFNQQWFNEHARAVLASRKLGADILRANWVAELFLESKENSRIELPDSLLACFMQGLFVDSNGEPNGLHRMDSALHLLGNGRKLKGSPRNGGEIATEGK